MSDPRPLAPSPDQTLAYQGQQEYRPTSSLQPKAALVSFVLGLLAAAVVAGLLIGWYAAHMPVITGLAGVTQGVLLGLLLRQVFRRTRLHSLPAAIVLTILLGLACNLMTYAGLYVRRVYAVRNEIRREIASTKDQPGLPAMVMNLTDRPFAFYNNFFLAPETRHTGFVGFLLSKRVMNLGKEPTTVLTVFVINGLALLLATYKIGKSQVLEPFCEQCGGWFGPPTNAAVLPAERYAELAAVVESGDPAAAIALNRAVANEDMCGGCAVAQIRKCPSCGQTFADVVLKFASRRDTPATRPVRVTPEMVQALKSEPVIAVPEPESTPDIPPPESDIPPEA